MYCMSKYNTSCAMQHIAIQSNTIHKIEDQGPHWTLMCLFDDNFSLMMTFKWSRNITLIHVS